MDEYDSLRRRCLLSNLGAESRLEGVSLVVVITHRRLEMDDQK